MVEGKSHRPTIVDGSEWIIVLWNIWRSVDKHCLEVGRVWHVKGRSTKDTDEIERGSWCRTVKIRRSIEVGEGRGRGEVTASMPWKGPKEEECSATNWTKASPKPKLDWATKEADQKRPLLKIECFVKQSKRKKERERESALSQTVLTFAAEWMSTSKTNRVWVTRVEQQATVQEVWFAWQAWSLNWEGEEWSYSLSRMHHTMRFVEQKESNRLQVQAPEKSS
jgi:hypothetical protein